MTATSWGAGVVKRLDGITDTFVKAYAARSIGMEEINADAYMDTATYAVKVRAEMETQVVREVGKQAVRHLSNKCGMAESELVEFIRFLREDPEIHSRYIAYKTAKRLRGE